MHHLIFNLLFHCLTMKVMIILSVSITKRKEIFSYYQALCINSCCAGKIKRHSFQYH